MKVLIATGIYPPEVGGPATYAFLLAQALPKRGIEVKVLPFSNVRKYPIILRHFIYFLKVIKDGRDCDVVFTQDTVTTGVPVVCASFFISRKVVLRVPGDYVWEQSRQRFGVTDSIDDFQKKKYSFTVEFFRFLQRFSVRHAHIVITPSNYFTELVSGWLGGIKKVSTIYNGIDTKVDFEKLEKFDKKTILSAGRLVPWKGFDTLMEAISKAPDWQLHIAGDGPDKGRLVKLASDLGVSNRVVFLGQISRPELFKELYRSHIFALLTTFESFSFQIVEAMFVGVPVIALNIGNLGEIIDSGVDGILISPDNADSFIGEASGLMDDNQKYNSMVEKANLKAEKFSFDKTTDNLVSVFKNLIK